MVMRRVRAAKKAAKELIDKANLRSGLTVTKPGPATTRRVMKRGRNVNVAAGGAGAAGLAAAATSGKDPEKKKATTKRRTPKNETLSQAAERIRRQKEDFERKKRSRKQADDAAASVKKTRELAKQAAKDPKAQKPAAPGRPPASSVKPPKADKMDTKTKVTKPKPTSKVKVDSPKLTKVTKRPKVTGKGEDIKSRDVVSKGPMGDRRLANVTVKQLKDAGLSTGPQGLRTYLNMYNKLKRRPKPSDFKTEKKTSKVIGSPASGKNRRPGGKAMGGMMKSKMSSKGGAKGGKKMAPGMMGGGMMKAKGMAKGGKMMKKGYAMGGAAMKKKGYKKGGAAGKFPDLTGDGKVTQKDILKGRGVPGFKKGGAMTKKGYAKGGMAKKGYAKGGAAMKSKGGKKGGVRRGKPRGVGVALRGFGKALR